MTEITRVHLENEMDLILSHKQTMKLAELCGLGLSAQTTLATAVSELGRSVLDCKAVGDLILLVSDRSEQEKLLTIQVKTTASGFNEQCDGLRLARKLVRGIQLISGQGAAVAVMQSRVAPGIRIDADITDRWRRYLNSDPEVSPYEEIKRKNRQLQEFASRLAESEQQYRDLTDSLPIIICTINSDGKILFGNSWLSEYSGLSIEQLNSNMLRDLIYPEDHPEILENIAKLKEGTFQRDRTYRLRQHATGQYRWHMGSITPVKGEQGDTRYWSIFLADIHAQKEMEAMLRDNQELRETKLLLEEKVEALDITNKQLEQFAYVASHDLQEPLRKVMHLSDYLRSRFLHALPPEVQDVLQRMSGATDRMKSLIADVLSYATIPDRNTEWKRVDMNVILREALQELELLVDEKSAHITSKPLPIIDGIAAQLKQLLVNLLNNALKYSEPSRQVAIRISGEVADGNLTLTIEDNGIGFENQYLPKMFAIFQRLHGRDKYSGTGIGLAICKKIVELHNGSITASGDLGLGAIFSVHLPVKQAVMHGDQSLRPRIDAPSVL